MSSSTSSSTAPPDEMKQLRESLEASPPVFPEALVEYYLKTSGCETNNDVSLARLGSKDLHKFIQDVIDEVKAMPKPLIKKSELKKKKVELVAAAAADRVLPEEETAYVLKASDVQVALEAKRVKVYRAPVFPR